MKTVKLQNLESGKRSCLPMPVANAKTRLNAPKLFVHSKGKRLSALLLVPYSAQNPKDFFFNQIEYQQGIECDKIIFHRGYIEREVVVHPSPLIRAPLSIEYPAGGKQDVFLLHTQNMQSFMALTCGTTMSYVLTQLDQKLMMESIFCVL